MPDFPQAGELTPEGQAILEARRRAALGINAPQSLGAGPLSIFPPVNQPSILGDVNGPGVPEQVAAAMRSGGAPSFSAANNSGMADRARLGLEPVRGAQPLATGSGSSYTSNPIGAGVGMLPRDAMAGGGGSGGGDPLSALAEQFHTIGRLTGSSPIAPQVNHMIESGSPTAGLMNLNSGRMVGDQTPSRAVVDPAAALEMQRYGLQDRSHGDDQRTLFERLGLMGQQAIAGANTNLDALRLLSPGGTLAQGQASIESQGMPRYQAAARDRFTNDFITQRTQAGTSIEDALNELRRIPGMEGASLPGFGGTGGVAGGSGGSAGGSSMPPPIGDTSPQSRLNALHRSATNIYGTPGANGQPGNIPPSAHSQAITHMVNGLGDSFVQENTPAVMRYIVDKFGPQSADAWFTERSSRLGRQTPQEQAIQSVIQAASRRSPGLVGTSAGNDQTAGWFNRLIGGLVAPPGLGPR